MSTPPNPLPEMQLLPTEKPNMKSSKKEATPRQKKSKAILVLESNPSSTSNLLKVPSEPELPRKSAALSRLGVSKEQLDSAPEITPILKETRGGIKMALSALRFSSDPAVEKFLAKYDSIPDRDRKSLPLEAIALAADVDIRALLGEIMLAVREHSVSRVKMIAIASHPEVIKRRVEFAQLPGGFRDRDALDTMLGALPRPNAATFIDKVFFGKPEPTNQETTKDPGEELASDEDYIFPDASEIQERIQPMRQRMLEGK